MVENLRPGNIFYMRNESLLIVAQRDTPAQLSVISATAEKRLLPSRQRKTGIYLAVCKNDETNPRNR
jgi:hypothetical protein